MNQLTNPQVNLLIPAIAVLSTVYLVIGPFFVNPYPCLLWIAITLIGWYMVYRYSVYDLSNSQSADFFSFEFAEGLKYRYYGFLAFAKSLI